MNDVKNKKKKPVTGVKGGRTMTGQPADTINVSPQIGKQVNEQSRGAAVFSFGRMNPPTVGHEKLVNKLLGVAKQYRASPMIFLSHNQDKKKNPLNYADKVRFASKAFGSIVQPSEAKTIFEVLKSLHGKYKDLYMVVGSDRVKSFQDLLNAYNGKEYSFDSIKVISAGDRDPDDDSVAGMSASKMREAVRAKNPTAFKQGLPTRIQAHADEIFDLTRLGLELAEELEKEGLDLTEALTPDQRRRRGMVMRRNERKILRAKEMARKRMASSDQLKIRATNKARDIIRKRLSGGKNYDSLTVSEKTTIDRLMQSRKAAVKRLAGRILNRVKNAEFERLKAYHSGQKELPHPAMSNEELNAVSIDQLVHEMMQAVTERAITEKVAGSLTNKATKANIPYVTLEEVFRRGFVSSMGDQRSAFDRVNSFVAGGRTAMNEDYDLYERNVNKDLDDLFAQVAQEEQPKHTKKTRHKIELRARGTDELRPEIQHVRRTAQAHTSMARQASIRHKLDERLELALGEEIKGWKQAAGDISKFRKQAKDEAKQVKLVRLKKNGDESKLYDAISKHADEKAARDRHTQLTKLNPGRGISHNLYVNDKLVDTLKEEVRSADTKGVVVRTASGKTVVRKQKVNRKIIGSGNLTDGTP